MYQWHYLPRKHSSPLEPPGWFLQTCQVSSQYLTNCIDNQHDRVRMSGSVDWSNGNMRCSLSSVRECTTRSHLVVETRLICVDNRSQWIFGYRLVNVDNEVLGFLLNRGLINYFASWDRGGGGRFLLKSAPPLGNGSGTVHWSWSISTWRARKCRNLLGLSLTYTWTAPFSFRH
jgi:hypothetical protein